MSNNAVNLENITMIEKDFIAQFPGFVPADFCKMLIENFEINKNMQKNIIYSAKDNIKKNLPLLRDDSAWFLNYHDKHAENIVSWLWIALGKYVEKYQQLAEVPLWPSELKLQCTEPTGGFHTWHYESSNYSMSQRELVWMIYLNDIPDGEGETEFLYQKTRVKPTVGTLVIWPAGMTHVHRGNTMFTQNKYILTGWFIKIPR
jgi:hypothetical protein